MGLFLCSRYDIIERSTECGQHNSNMHRTLFYFLQLLLHRTAGTAEPGKGVFPLKIFSIIILKQKQNIREINRA